MKLLFLREVREKGKYYGWQLWLLSFGCFEGGLKEGANGYKKWLGSFIWSATRIICTGVLYSECLNRCKIYLLCAVPLAVVLLTLAVICRRVRGSAGCSVQGRARYISGMWRGVVVRWWQYSCYCTWSYISKFNIETVMSLKCADVRWWYVYEKQHQNTICAQLQQAHRTGRYLVFSGTTKSLTALLGQP